MNWDLQKLSHGSILSTVAELRELISSCSTVSVAGAAFLYHLRYKPGERRKLHSPAKQWSFLLGLLMGQPEPEEPRDFGASELASAQELLNKAFSAYEINYYPDPKDRSDLSEEWWRVRDVALPAFMHYFYSRLLASGAQIEARIVRYLVPFDDAVKEELGVAVSDALVIAKWIGQQIQLVMDQTIEAGAEARRAQLELLDEAEQRGWGLEEIRKAAAQPQYDETFTRFFNGLLTTGLITRRQLEAEFPNAGATFWRKFSIGRGEGPVLQYPTERSIVDDLPLIRVSEDEAMCPSLGALYLAILERSEKVLSEGPARNRYFRARDKALEEEVQAHFRRLVDSSCSIHSAVFETDDHQFEHDAVVLCDDLCLIIEAKASPPKEPFRNPEKAFVRLNRAFKAETGIQGGYEQALRIWRRLAAGEDVVLFDGEGAPAVTIPGALLEDTYCVVATRDDFGPLAGDLALLLEKEATEPYPWVVNVTDLENLANAWSHFGWSGKELEEYLKGRTRLHGKLFCDDELEVAGYFIQHGNIMLLSDSYADKVSLDPTYSSVFDKLYAHIHHGAPAPKIERTPPVIADLTTSLKTGQTVFVQPDGTPIQKKVGRNAPCPCGSGKKYKKCCGKPGRQA